jgi:hypothetical protein
VKAPRVFKVAAAFNPTATRGVFVGYSTVSTSHSGIGLPGGSEKPAGDDRDWMIRAVLSKKRPKNAAEGDAEKGGAPRRNPIYLEDFKFLRSTVGSSFPALRKKGVDWKAVCRAWEQRFRDCLDDRTHIENVHRLLALLGDSHTGLTRSSVTFRPPAFDGLYGGGIWIAAEGGRLILRAVMDGHRLAGELKPGAVLVRTGARPARLAHEDVRRRCRTWYGWSSEHFLDARLSFQFFRFEGKTLPLVFLDPDGREVKVDLGKWGPGGRGLSRARCTLPEGLEPEGGAVSKKLSGGVGYIRILGGMNRSTQDDFFEALDELGGVRAVLLDCRGMGGGGDGPAWAMAGRFFKKRTPNGINGYIDPTGSWQFDGPVVMLQDEREISSAETFTWAMTETGRAVSVGRPTGGATIIPRGFSAPSGLFSFRLGCTDRPTPIRGIRPEGIGSAPDVYVPYAPCLFQKHRDPVLAAGRDICLFLLAGAEPKTVVDFYGGVLGADPQRVKSSCAAFSKIEKPSREAGFSDLCGGVVEPLIDWEITVCDSRHNPMPCYGAGLGKLERLGQVARILGNEKAARRAAGPGKKWQRERKAEAAWEKLTQGPWPPEKKALRTFRARHRGTKYAKVAEALR